MRFIRTICLYFMLTALLTIAAPATATHYLVVSPDPTGLNSADRETVFQSLGQLIMGAQDGDLISFYNSTNPERLMRLTIPQGDRRRRVRVLANDIQRLRQHFAGEAPEASATRHDLPATVSDIIRPALRAADGPTQVVLFGNQFETTTDPQGRFGVGEVPSLSHLFADRNRSPWSTRGHEEDLQGATIHWVTLGDEDATTVEKRAVAEFYAAFFASQGGALIELLPAGNSGDLIEGALAGQSEPLMEVDVDPAAGDPLLIRRVARSVQQHDEDDDSALNEARQRVDRRAADTLQWLDARDAIAYGNAIDVYVLVDTSMSWSEARASVLASIEAAARVIPEYSPRCRLSIIPFRQEAMDGLDLTRIRQFKEDDGDSQAELSAYLLEITGEQTTVDLKGVVIDSLAELSQATSPGRTVWCLVTDTIPQEWDQDDTQAESEMARAIEAWTQLHDGNRVVTLYVGDDQGGEQAQFMQRLAEAAGTQGACTVDKSRIIHDILIAALYE